MVDDSMDLYVRQRAAWNAGVSPPPFGAGPGDGITTCEQVPHSDIKQTQNETRILEPMDLQKCNHGLLPEDLVPRQDLPGIPSRALVTSAGAVAGEFF